MGLKNLIFDAGIDYLDELHIKMFNALKNATIALSHNQPVTAKKYLIEYEELRNKAKEISLELDTKYK